jgi:hypothetical protein
LRYRILLPVLIAAGVSFGQIFRDAVILDIETDSAAQWRLDITDPSRVAASNDPVPPAAMLNFYRSFSIQDVRYVNGLSAKGVVLFRTDRINLSPSPALGGSIADVVRGTAAEVSIEILQDNGTPVGTLVGSGLAGGSPPPGAVGASASNIAITGGTGAFLGARGQMVFLPTFQVLPLRDLQNWSAATSPSRRRELSMGTASFRIYLLPAERPTVLEVLHASGAPVTPAAPARKGETIVIRASGLGPVAPALPAGQAFPGDPFALVNSPVQAVIGSTTVDAAVKIGWPGQTEIYRVDIVVPPNAPPGEQTLRLFAAWVPSPAVRISIE